MALASLLLVLSAVAAAGRAQIPDNPPTTPSDGIITIIPTRDSIGEFLRQKIKIAIPR
jgi:hypothetical protein